MFPLAKETVAVHERPLLSLVTVAACRVSSPQLRLRPLGPLCGHGHSLGGSSKGRAAGCWDTIRLRGGAGGDQAARATDPRLKRRRDNRTWRSSAGCANKSGNSTGSYGGSVNKCRFTGGCTRRPFAYTPVAACYHPPLETSPCYRLSSCARALPLVLLVSMSVTTRDHPVHRVSTFLLPLVSMLPFTSTNVQDRFCYHAQATLVPLSCPYHARTILSPLSTTVCHFALTSLSPSSELVVSHPSILG